MKIIFVLLVFVVGSILTVQQLYVFKHERCDVKYYSEYSYNGNYKCYKINRKELYLNLSLYLNVTIENDKEADIFVIGYQFRSNEYSKGPVEFRMGLCSAANRKDFDIPKMIENSNFKCPLREHQKIYTNKLTPNASNFPPLLPEGRWKLQLDFSYKKVIVMTINWYASVEYPIKWPSN